MTFAELDKCYKTLIRMIDALPAEDQLEILRKSHSNADTGSMEQDVNTAIVDFITCFAIEDDCTVKKEKALAFAMFIAYQNDTIISKEQSKIEACRQAGKQGRQVQIHNNQKAYVKPGLGTARTTPTAPPGQPPDNPRTPPGQPPDNPRTTPGQPPDNPRTPPKNHEKSTVSPGRASASSRARARINSCCSSYLLTDNSKEIESNTTTTTTTTIEGGVGGTTAQGTPNVTVQPGTFDAEKIRLWDMLVEAGFPDDSATRRLFFTQICESQEMIDEYAQTGRLESIEHALNACVMQGEGARKLSYLQGVLNNTLQPKKAQNAREKIEQQYSKEEMDRMYQDMLKRNGFAV